MDNTVPEGEKSPKEMIEYIYIYINIYLQLCTTLFSRVETNFMGSSEHGLCLHCLCFALHIPTNLAGGTVTRMVARLHLRLANLLA